MSGERFRGIRIFDISDISRPKQGGGADLPRVAHAHARRRSRRQGERLRLRVGDEHRPIGRGRARRLLAPRPEGGPNTSLYSIDVIQVPVATLNAARSSVSRACSRIPRRAPLPGCGAAAITARARRPHVRRTSATTSPCSTRSDSRPEPCWQRHPARHPRSEEPGQDRSGGRQEFAYWHSATFNHDGTKVIFTDEWGGGSQPRCRPTDQPTWGADAIFDVVDRKLRFASYYKMPAPQTEQENCVAHNGSLIPVPGRDIMVQAWYQGGVSIFDFTDSAHPVEIAHFDRGPLDPKQLILGGYWSTYGITARSAEPRSPAASTCFD